MKTAGQTHLRSRRLAWDHVEFQVPWNWDIGLYKFLRKGVTRIEVEDEYAVRLEAEWVKPRKELEQSSILKRYQIAVEKFTATASESVPITGLPEGWTATRFIIKETAPNPGKSGLKLIGRQHIAALYIGPRSELVFFAFLHCEQEDPEDPLELMRLLAGGFRHHSNNPLIPWELFDIAFELPREFVLESAQFDVGAKLMIYRWKMRRFHLWHFSCADAFLKDDVVMEEWVAGYLNAYAGIRGVVFLPGNAGEIRWRRRWRHPFGHRNEMMRACFKFKIGCHRDPVKNQLKVWVFNHRNSADIEMIPAALRFDK